MNRQTLIFVIVLLLLFIGIVIYRAQTTFDPRSETKNTKQNETSSSSDTSSTARVSIIAKGLDTPWAIAFLPDNSMLVTERKGTVRFVDAQGNLASKPVATLSSVREIGEGGLLGLALHPDFPTNNFVYLYYTYSGSPDSNTRNRVVRMTYDEATKKLGNEVIILDNIPGASNHNGGRIKFGPDKMLYITTGDAEVPTQAQDTKTLGGKILRVTDTGKPAPGNPFGNLVYSYGHRNPQGLIWDDKGILWSTEHGPSGVQSGNDEVNKIEPGKNYGWPIIQGDQEKKGMVKPFYTSGTSQTWAPGDIAYTYKNNAFYFTGLRGSSLYVFYTGATSSNEVDSRFKDEFGRLREVIIGPDNMLYVTTSNQDGRGLPTDGDDKIIRINPDNL